jgi:hypothetical protein
MHDSFPEHWYYNTTYYQIGNYLEFNSEMILSMNSKIIYIDIFRKNNLI